MNHAVSTGRVPVSGSPFRGGGRRWVALACALGLVTCTNDHPTGPHGLGTGYFAVRPLLTSGATSAAFGLPEIDSVRVVAIRPVADTAVDTTAFFPPDSTTIHLVIPVTLQASTETFTLVLQLRALGRPLYAGVGSVQVSVGVSDSVPTADIPLDYVGPGAGITGIQIVPRDTVVRLLQTKQFSVIADSNGVPVSPDSVHVSWSTSDPTLAPIDSLGVLQAPGMRGTVLVRAVTPNATSDSTPVTFIPAPTALAVASGDAQTAAVGTALPLPLRARVTAADLLGVKGIPVRFQALTGGGTVRDSVVVTDSLGFAEDSVTLGTQAGAQAFTATAGGLPPVTFDASALAGPISPATSVITVSSSTIISGTAAVLTLQARDAFGNALITGGATVTFNAAGGTSTGTIGAVTDHGDGTYTADFTGALAGTATTIGATIDGTAVTSPLPTLTVTVGAISATTSSVTVSAATVVSGASVTLTLTGRDAAGNALTSGGATVTFSASGGTSTGTIGSVSDNGDGTYTASLVGVLAGTATTIGATVNGAPVTTTLPSLTVTPGAVSAATSSVSVSAPTVVSGGVVGLTLQAKDASGNPLTSGGATVTFGASGGTSTGTIGPVTDNGDGTYSASFTAVTAGTATTIGATVNGVAVSSALPAIAVTAGAVSATTSVVSTSSGTVTAGATATLTLQARDAAGNPLSSGGAVVGFTATGGTSTGTIGATTDHGDGTYTATFTGILAGTATTIGATIDGASTTSTTSLTVVPGNSVAAQSIVTVSASTVVSGSVITLTLQARDSLGNDITTGGSSVTFGYSGGTSTGAIGATTDNGNGTYTADFTGVLAGTPTTIGATIDGAPVTSTLPTVSVTPGAVSPATSLVSVSAASVVAGGTVTLSLQARDAAGNNLATGGATVAFTATGGTSTGTIGSTTDHNDGTYTAPFTGQTAGTADTIGATVDGSPVTSTLPTVTVTAGAASASTSVISVSSATVASGDSVILTLQAKDASGNLLTSGGATVVFTDSGGSGASTGTIKPTPAIDNADGTYTASFTGVLAGTATTIGATIDGAPVSTTRPTVTVTPGAISTARSLVSVSKATVASGDSATLTLQAEDAQGNPLTTGGEQVVFTDSGGASTGTIAPTPATDNGDGTYAAAFTGVLAGTATSILATINGNLVATARPTVTVTPGVISTATSLVTVRDSTVAVGAVDTLFLQGKDAAGNALTSGGDTVAFTQSGGTSAGAIGATTDLGNGKYRAPFTGQTAGTPDTIHATINGNAVTSTPLPTIRVTQTGTTHSADITANETWTAAQSPHIVTGYLRVLNGATLTIAAGAVVKFDAGAGLQVGDTTAGQTGGLVLDGTAGLITLTANTPTPTPGYWRGLELQQTLAVAPWYNVLIEWGGGPRSPAGAVPAEACLLVIDNSGLNLVADSLRIRQCNEAGIRLFGGTLAMRLSEIDSVTGAGIHEDFKGVLNLDTTRIVGSGQEGLLVSSPRARLSSMAGNVFLDNALASIHIDAHQLRGFKQQDSIAGNGFLPGGFGDSIVVDSGLVNANGVAFALHHQGGPYLFTGPVKIINGPVTLSRGFTAAFAPGAVFQVGDSTPGDDAQIEVQGTVDSQVVLRNRPGTPGWPGVFLGRQSAPPALHHMRIIGGGYNPGQSVTANLLAEAAGGTGPLAVDSVTSDSSRGHGIAILSAPASGFRVRDDSIHNAAGIGLLVLAGGGAADTIAGNVLTGNEYPLSLGAAALPGLGANVIGPNTRDTLLLAGGRLTTNATLPHVAGSPWRATAMTTVDSNAVLTIAAGDTVAFDSLAGILVGDDAPGALAVAGTSAEPILLTASYVPAGFFPRGWGGIEWRQPAASGNVFAFATVERAGFVISPQGDFLPFPVAALRIADTAVATNASLTFDHIVVRGALATALDVERAGTGTVAVTNSQFYDNDFVFDTLITAPRVQANQLSISGSDLYHYRLPVISAANTVVATNNWWGDVQGPDTGFAGRDSLGRAALQSAPVQFAPVATAPFFSVGSAAGVVTTQDSILSPAPSIGTADSIRVRVVDAFGRGASGQSVTWTVSPAAGSAVTSQATGETGGRIDALWTFGTTAGQFVATATGPAGAARYYADVQPGADSSVNWTLDAGRSQGNVTAPKAITFTSTARTGVVVTNAVDNFGNAVPADSIIFADPGGKRNFTYGTVDSTRSSGGASGDTVFFHTSTTQPPQFVLRGYYTNPAGAPTLDSVLITMAPAVAGVKIDRDAFASGVQAVPDTVAINSICPTGPSNSACQSLYQVFVVDSGLAPIPEPNASFGWTLVPPADTAVTLDSMRNDFAWVTGRKNGVALVAVTDVSGNNFGTDTLPIRVQQLPAVVTVSPDTTSVLVGANATFTAAVTDAGGDPMPGYPVRWRPDNTFNPHITIVDSSVAGQVTVRLDSTPFGGEYVDALAARAPGDTVYGFGQILNPVWTQYPVGLQPWAIAANTQTHAVYAGHQGGQLYVLDGASEKVTDSVQVGATTSAVVVNSITDRVYTSTDKGLVVLDGTSHAVLATVAVGVNNQGVTTLQGLTVDSINDRIYVTVVAPVGGVPAPVLRRVDGATNTFSTSNDVVLPDTGVSAVFNAADGLVYVAIANSNLVAAVNPATNTIDARIPVCTAAHAMALNPVTQKLYVDCGVFGTGGEVSVIDLSTATVTTTIPVSYYAGGITVDAIHNRVYVGVSNQPYVVLIDGATDTWQTVLSTGDPFFFDDLQGLCYDGSNGKLFTANYSSGTITRLEY